jgi:hypothetical protein
MGRKRVYTDAEIKQHLQDAKERYYADTRWSRNGYSRWTEDEISLLNSGEFSDRELAIELGRSMMAIQVKRCMLKRCKDAENNTSIPE